MAPQTPGARVVVEISEDRMEARVTVNAGAPSSGSVLSAALSEAGVVFGVDAPAVARLGEALADGAFSCPRVVVAAGRPAVAGRDAEFSPEFDPGIQPGTLRQDGSMDFNERELLKPVVAGARIGEILPARLEVPARRVDGSADPQKAVRELRLRLGAGVARGEEGALVASRAGVVLFVAGESLDVVTHHEHGGDVDLRSGDLRMEGSLLVKGDVTRRFDVRATGDVEIAGSVESGTVYSGGNVTVRGGVRGGDAGIVSAEGALSVRHAEGATLVCGGTLQVEDAMGSELRGRRIVVTRRLRGGVACSEESLVVAEAGSPQGSGDTTLVAGEPLERPVLDARRALGLQKAQRMAEHRARGSGDRLKGGKLGRLLAAQSGVDLALQAARCQRRDELQRTAEIHVHGALHPAVTVRVGQESLVVEDALHGVRFSIDPEHGGIRMERSGP